MLFDTIAELIAERTGCEKTDIKESSTFTELGIDSLDTVELLMNLEDSTGMNIELTEKVETVGELINFIERKAKEQKADAVKDM